MADLSSTRVFGKLTVIHEAILKANAEITGDVTASSFAGDGSLLTNLNASNLASGTVPEARLPASALVGDTTYSAGSGITLSGTTFRLTNESYTSAEKTKLAGIEAGAQVNVATNLGQSKTATTYTITSSTGTNTTLAAATTSAAGVMSATDKTKLNGIEAGAEVNVGTNLGSSGTGATRTITSSTGSNTSITYSAADVGAPPTSRTISAGTGLSGGGNLSANRTLSVTYGTTAGTAAQGNDSRLSNSREWTASTVSQSEAEAGTSTTRRAWTAQRVRQAIDAAVATAVASAVPTGVITMWSGSTSSVPSGWALCDGNNGTPNLLDRFIVGAGGAYEVGDTGGAANVTLTTAQIPAHNHSGSTGSAGSHSHSGSASSAGGHSHGVLTDASGTQASNGRRPRASGAQSGGSASSGAATSAGAHTHSLSINSNGSHTHSVTVSDTGGGEAHENRPPYYALAYIMKL